MSDNLPPLPKPWGWSWTHSVPFFTDDQMREYAAAAVAERDAEIARLRGENKALQDGIVRDFVDVGVKNAITELRAEVEALRADAEKHYAAGRAAEREACANLCESEARMHDHGDVTGRGAGGDRADVARTCAAVIRQAG